MINQRLKYRKDKNLWENVAVRTILVQTFLIGPNPYLYTLLNSCLSAVHTPDTCRCEFNCVIFVLNRVSLYEPVSLLPQNDPCP